MHLDGDIELLVPELAQVIISSPSRLRKYFCLLEYWLEKMCNTKAYIIYIFLI